MALDFFIWWIWVGGGCRPLAAAPQFSQGFRTVSHCCLLYSVYELHIHRGTSACAVLKAVMFSLMQRLSFVVEYYFPCNYS